jgi:2-methylcitrate dehydratase PrpD
MLVPRASKELAAPPRHGGREETMTTLCAIAGRIAATSYDDLPPEAVHWAKVAILDTVGVTLAGSRETGIRIIEHVTNRGAASGECMIIGGERRAAALDAALVNGAAAHALDYDDASDALGGHPSAVILPGLLALGETANADGRRFLAAYVTGFETAARIGRGVNFHHSDKGWHATSTIGIFGAAAACCHLLALTPERIAHALGLAASLAAGIGANFGTMTELLHVGHCARDGLLAALLAQQGFTANPAAFDHPQGFGAVFNGMPDFDTAAMLRDWGQPFDIVTPGVAIKRYPCCGSIHSALDAMLALREAHGLASGDVERVDSWTHPRRLVHTDRPNPQTAIEARASAQYCLARALRDGAVGLDHFTESAHQDPEIRRLMRRIHLAPHPEMAMTGNNGFGGPFGGEVRIFLKCGRVLSARVDRPLGRGSDRPLPEDAVRAKFAECAGRVLSAAAVSDLYRMLCRLETLDTLRTAMAAMTPMPLRPGWAADHGPVA